MLRTSPQPPSPEEAAQTDLSRVRDPRAPLRRRPNSRKYRRGYLLRLAGLGVLCLWLGGCAQSVPVVADNDRADGPVKLADAQLDQITAGRMTFEIDLAALARGTNVTTSTWGIAHSVHGDILRFKIDSHGVVLPSSVHQQTVDLAYGVGRATAKGSEAADSSASINVAGSVIFRQGASSLFATQSQSSALSWMISVAASH